MPSVPTLPPFLVGLPVVWPALDTTLGKDYYKDFQTTGPLLATETKGSAPILSLTIPQPGVSHPAPWGGTPRGTLLTPTTALVRFVPKGKTIDEIAPALPAPTDSLVLRPLWVGKASASLLFLNSDVPPADWPTALVFSNVDLASYRLAVQARADHFRSPGVIRRLLAVSGLPGNLKGLTLDVLRQKYVDRAMAGDLTRLVHPWKPIGSVAANGTLDIRAYRKADDPTDSGYRSPSDLIMEFFERADPDSRILYMYHPLIELIRGAQTTVTMNPTHTVRDNTVADNTLGNQFVNLPATGVEVSLWRRTRKLIDPVFAMEKLTSTTLGGSAYSLYPGDKIHYRYKFQSQIKIGNRSFIAGDELRTPEHRVSTFLNNGTIQKTYRAAYSFYRRYTSFIYQLSIDSDRESFDGDRGNAETLLDFSTEATEFLLDSQRRMLETLYRTEARYTRDNLPAKAFTIFFEGDSWTHYPLGFGDIYRYLKQCFRKDLRAECALNLFPLQHFGDRANQMVGSSTRQPDQWTLTKDLLKEYGAVIDLVVCSMGGNDLAEPGISNSYNRGEQKQADRIFLSQFYTSAAEGGGYFDVGQIDSRLNVPLNNSPSPSPLWKDIVTRGLNGSFASLLKDHPWRKYLTGASDNASNIGGLIHTAAAHWNIADGESFTALATGPASGKTYSRQIADHDPNNPQGFDFTTLAQNVKTEILDVKRFEDRLGLSNPQPSPGVLQYWIQFLDAIKSARPGGIPVFTHSYCYPLFRQSPAVNFQYPGTDEYKQRRALLVTGPWFVNRFTEAAEATPNLPLGFALTKVLFLKAMLDDYWNRILTVLQNNPNYDFHPVDVRRLNAARAFWRDEMHTRGIGFLNTSAAIYAEIRAKKFLQDGRF